MNCLIYSWFFYINTLIFNAMNYDTTTLNVLRTIYKQSSNQLVGDNPAQFKCQPRRRSLTHVTSAFGLGNACFKWVSLAALVIPLPSASVCDCININAIGHLHSTTLKSTEYFFIYFFINILLIFFLYIKVILKSVTNII